MRYFFVGFEPTTHVQKTDDPPPKTCCDEATRKKTNAKNRTLLYNSTYRYVRAAELQLDGALAGTKRRATPKPRDKVLTTGADRGIFKNWSRPLLLLLPLLLEVPPD